MLVQASKIVERLKEIEDYIRLPKNKTVFSGLEEYLKKKNGATGRSVTAAKDLVELIAKQEMVCTQVFEALDPRIAELAHGIVSINMLQSEVTSSQRKLKALSRAY
jgi:hypothetical protein